MQDKALWRGVHSTSIPAPLSSSLSLFLCITSLSSCSFPLSCYIVLSKVWSLFLVLISFFPPGESQKMKPCEQTKDSGCVCVCGCVSLGCILNCPTDESIHAAQSVAFSRKPICCLIDLSKDKTTLYFGGLSIWKAVNSVRSGERKRIRV